MRGEKNIIFYDSDCLLCSGFVHFVIKREKGVYFQFTDFQSKSAKILLKNFPSDSLIKERLLFLEGKELYHSSEAVIRIFKKLCFPWFLLGKSHILPFIFREALYRWIAQRRYKLFGRAKRCALPAISLKKRFI